MMPPFVQGHTAGILLTKRLKREGVRVGMTYRGRRVMATQTKHREGSLPPLYPSSTFYSLS